MVIQISEGSSVVVVGTYSFKNGAPLRGSRCLIRPRFLWQVGFQTQPVAAAAQWDRFYLKINSHVAISRIFA